MRIVILSFFLLTIGCAAVSGGNKIQLPQVENKAVQNDYIKEAVKTKIRIGSRNGQNFDFFYGPKGSYFIVVSADGKRMNLDDYDVILSIIDTKKEAPEQILMAVDAGQVASGFGDVREGVTNFELLLNPVNPEFNRPIKFNFSVKIETYL